MSDDIEWYGAYKQANGKRLNKYAVGTCIFELPFFLAAHLYCLALNQYPADGYSLPYCLAGVLATVFWVILGLIYLRNFLKKYFDDNVTSFTILCIAFGTNLYTYTVFCPAMSHPYLFFLFSSLLYYTDLWYTEFSRRSIYSLAFILGLIIITRPIDIIGIIIPVFWKIHDFNSLKERYQLIIRKKQDVLKALFIFFGVCLLQMSYWKFTSGHWIYYSYKGEGFNFLHPKILKGLFSYQKGWFLYTPIAFVSMCGFYSLYHYDKRLAPSILIFFFLMIWSVFSWYMWWYGGGFSCRALIETLAIAAMPLAALIKNILFISKKHLIKHVYIAILVLFIFLNIFQSYQFIYEIISWDKMTRTSYWRVFGKLNVDIKEESKYLMNDRELNDELIPVK